MANDIDCVYHFIYHSMAQVINFPLFLFLSTSLDCSQTEEGEKAGTAAAILYFIFENFCNFYRAHLLSILRSRIWYIVEKPQVTIKHFFRALPLSKRQYHAKRTTAKKMSGHFSNWRKEKKSIVNWFLLENTHQNERLKTARTTTRKENCQQNSNCVQHSVRSTISSVKYNAHFVSLLFFLV